MKEKRQKKSKQPSGKLEDLLPSPKLTRQIKQRLDSINQQALRDLEEQRGSPEQKRARGK
jgi:hypothetical protein